MKAIFFLWFLQQGRLVTRWYTVVLHVSRSSEAFLVQCLYWTVFEIHPISSISHSTLSPLWKKVNFKVDMWILWSINLFDFFWHQNGPGKIWSLKTLKAKSFRSKFTFWKNYLHKKKSWCIKRLVSVFKEKYLVRIICIMILVCFTLILVD